MAKLPFRVRKALRLHQGASAPTIFKSLEPFGFTKEALEEGRKKLGAVSLLRKKEVIRDSRDPGLNVRIEEFQSLWFPIVRATLNAGFPALSPTFFEGLIQRKGIEAPMSLTTFVARIRELESDTVLFGAEGAKARELLSKRGLTEAVLATAEELLECWGEVREDEVVAPAPADELKQAIEAVWDWYVEWATIARAVLSRPRDLRVLGIGRRRDGRQKAELGAAEVLPALSASIASAPLLAQAQEGPIAAE